MNSLDVLDIVPTKAMLLKATPQSEFKATVFESRKSKAKSSNFNSRLSGGSKDENDFNLKKAKHEVFNFGVSGFESKDKEAAKMSLAIRLGAKQPKNEYKNYKEVIAASKEAHIKSKENAALLQLGKNSQGGASVTYKKLNNARRKKKLDGQITRHYGVVNPKIFQKKSK